MSAYLQLFIDTDYIIPVVDTYDGNLQKYSSEDGTRLWLYFYDSPYKSGVDSGRSNKAGFESGLPGYIGNFWQNIEKNTTYNNGIAEVAFCDLLEHSGILKKLRDFYSESVGEVPTIPLVCIFSDSITLVARKKFLQYMKERFFEVLSYSIPMSELAIAKMLHGHRSIHPQFGDKIMQFQSSGKDLLLSYLTFDGSAFLSGEKPNVIANSGNAPVKKALIEFVVNKIDDHQGFLSAETRPKEYSYQMQFADEWLKKSKDRASFIIDDFHYSSDPSITYSCKVDCSYLRSIQENAIRDLLNTIDAYKKKVIKNDLLQVILLGDAFQDDLFQEKVIQVIGDSRKITYFSDIDLQEALHMYFYKYKELREDLNKVDAIYRQRINQADAINMWVQSAEKLRSLLIDAQNATSNYQIELERARKEYDNQAAQWLVHMQQHQFDKAQSIIGTDVANAGNIQSLNVKADELISRSETYSNLYTKVSQFEGANKIVNSILSLLRQLSEMTGSWQALQSSRSEKREQTDYFRNSHILYKEKLKELKKEGSHTVRQRIIEELKKLSLAPVPVIDIDELKVNLQAEIIKSGGFFKKKKTLKVKIQVEGNKELPCRCALVISPKGLVRIRRDEAYVEDIEDGKKGMWEYNYELPLPQTQKASELYLYFWPHEDEMVSINAFSVNKCNIKL